MKEYGIQKSLDYIEKNLEHPIKLERVAEKSGYSLYHFHRVFSGITGYTLKEYIRKRRLTRSARMLKFTGKSISEIAHLCGFKSQEAFTRAFSGHFGETPHKFRKTEAPFEYTSQIKIKTSSSGAFPLDHRIENISDFEICGLAVKVTPNDPRLQTLWIDLWKYAKHFDMQKCRGFYALSTSTGNVKEIPEFHYLVGAKPECFKTIPPEFVTEKVKGSTFLVFEYRDGLEKLDDFFVNLFTDWLPANGYKAKDFDLEFYSKDYSVDDEKSVIEILVPLNDELKGIFNHIALKSINQIELEITK